MHTQRIHRQFVSALFPFCSALLLIGYLLLVLGLDVSELTLVFILNFHESQLGVAK